MRLDYYATGFVRSIFNFSLAKWCRDEWDGFLYRKTMRRKLGYVEEWKLIREQQSRITIDLQKEVKIDLSTKSELARLIYVHSFERDERIFLNRFIRPGDTVLDIGANVGLFTVIAAKLVGESGRVYAFEPSERTAKELDANIKLNDFQNITVINKAVTAKEGTFHLNDVKEGYDAWSSLAGTLDGYKSDVVEIDGVSLDSFCRGHVQGDITLIKIDVEGWESEVLKGGGELLSSGNAPVLQVEFTDEAAELAGSSCQDLYEQIISLGYELYSYDSGLNKLVASPIKSEYPYENLFAVKNLVYVNSVLNDSIPPVDIW